MNVLRIIGFISSIGCIGFAIYEHNIDAVWGWGIASLLWLEIILEHIIEDWL